jgi:hypothetical protein
MKKTTEHPPNKNAVNAFETVEVDTGKNVAKSTRKNLEDLDLWESLNVWYRRNTPSWNEDVPVVSFEYKRLVTSWWHWPC